MYLNPILAISKLTYNSQIIKTEKAFDQTHRLHNKWQILLFHDNLLSDWRLLNNCLITWNFCLLLRLFFYDCLTFVRWLPDVCLIALWLPMTSWLLSNNFLSAAWGMLRTSILLFDDCLAYAWQPEDYFTTAKMIVILNRHINNLPYPKGKEIGHHGQPYLQKSHNFGQNLEILAIVFVDLRYRLSAEEWANIRSCCCFWLDLLAF